MLFLHSGKAHVEYYPKKASTVFVANSLVYPDGSGAIQPADATSGDHIGVILKAVAATDSDYADNTMVPVMIPNDDTIFIADATSGAAALVGTQVDLTNAYTVNGGASSKKVVTVVGYISSTKLLVKINARITADNVATT